MKTLSTDSAKKTIRLKVEDFGKAVLVTGHVNYLLRGDYYRRMSEKSGPKWLLAKEVWNKIPIKERLSVVSDELLAWYRTTPWYREQVRVDFLKLSTVRELSSWENVVAYMMSMDGFLYDINGRPLWRPFRIGSCYSSYRSPEYHVDAVATHLKKNPKVKDVEIREIEYYNKEEGDNDGRYVCFTYLPTEREFRQLRKESGNSPSEIEYGIMKKLRTAKFRIRKYGGTAEW